MAPGKIVKFSAHDVVKRARTANSKPFHWAGPDIDAVIRPRSIGEAADMVREAQQFTRDQEQYAGTPDEPSLAESFRLRLRHTLPCILDPEDGQPYFTADDIDALMELDLPTLSALLDEADIVSGTSATQREEAEKNSGTTELGNSSSVSPDNQATSTSSPTPTPSAIS